MNKPAVRIIPRPEWWSTFPVRYYFVDFGYSAHFKEDSRLSECTVDPFPQGREHRAPETQGVKPFNPFAADVYQTVCLLYGWFPDIAHNVRSLLKLLQDMSCYNPSRRITASTALATLRTFRSTIPDDNGEREFISFPYCI